MRNQTAETEQRTSRRQLWLAAGAMVAIALLKLWLIDTEEIAGSATQYDALWFVRSAHDWYWQAHYDWIAFVRPPAYPLWLAVVHWCGVRQRLAIEVLQLASFAAVVVALRRAGISTAAAIAAFALACFHPGSIHLNNYTMADPFYAAVLSFFSAGLIFTLVTRSAVVAALSGAAGAVLWLTREETVLIVLLLSAFLILWIRRHRSLSGSWRSAARSIWKSAMVMVAVLLLIVVAVYTANRRTFLAFAKSEMTAPSFERAVAALIRIKPQQYQRYVPVPRESLERAFAVSPTFARLKPAFDGEIGEAWRVETMNRTGVRGEIGINWLLWAIRNIATEIGVHGSARKAKRFYTDAAREVEGALRERRIEGRTVWASFVGPNLFREAHHLPGSVANLLSLFIAEYDMSPTTDDAILLPKERALYDEVTLRRPAKTENRLAHLMKEALGTGHRFIILGLAIASIAALVRHQFRQTGRSVAPGLNAALLLLLVAIASRVGFFAVIDATSWPVTYDRFMYPVMPLASILLVALIDRGFRRGVAQ